MALTISEENKKRAEDSIKAIEDAQCGTAAIPVVGQIAGVALEGSKKTHKRYLNNIDLAQQYYESLTEIRGEQIGAENDRFYYQGLLDDLNRDKDDSEDWLEDYRQMLAGEGDADNLLLAQDRLNQSNIANAESELASYRDSSALELDSIIEQGFSEYTDRRQSEALQNIYASASGSVIGAHNSAARMARASLKAFTGGDFTFNETGAASLEEGGSGIGSFAKMMITVRQTVRDNTAKLQSNVDAANLAYMTFRDEAADVAEENEQFLEDYEDTRANYESNLKLAQDTIANLQAAADKALENLTGVVKKLNEYEEARDLELTTFS